MTITASSSFNEVLRLYPETTRFIVTPPSSSPPDTKSAPSGNIGDILTLSSRVSEKLSEQTQTFLTQLQQALSRAALPADTRFTLSVGPGDKIIASGPHKEKIERLFAENPELAKLFRAIIALQVLLDLQKANKRFQDEFDDARTEKERDTARQHYHDDMATIRRSGTSLSFSNGLIAMISLRDKNVGNTFVE